MRQFVLVVCILCTSFLSANDKIIWKEVQVPVYEIVDTNFIAFLDSCYAVASQRTWWDSAQVIDINVFQLLEDDRWRWGTLWGHVDPRAIRNNTLIQGNSVQLHLTLLNDDHFLPNAPCGIIPLKDKWLHLDANLVQVKQLFKPTGETITYKDHEYIIEKQDPNVILKEKQDPNVIPIIDDSELNYMYEFGTYQFDYQYTQTAGECPAVLCIVIFFFIS